MGCLINAVNTSGKNLWRGVWLLQRIGVKVIQKSVDN